MKRISSLAAAAVAVMASGLLLLGANAEAAPATTAIAPAPSAQAAPETITLPDGRTTTLPTAFSSMSVADLATYGIVPGMGQTGGKPQVQASSTQGSTVHPDSASGCNKNVCIYVRGKGLIVQSWETTAYSAPAECTFAVYWAPPNHVYATSNEVCGGSNSEYYAYLASAPVHFPNKTEICNSWIHISGKPCETVHS